MSRQDTPVPTWRLETARKVGPTEHPLREAMADMLDEMDEGHRRALEMWAWEGLTYEAIALELGLAGRSSGQDRVRQALRELEIKLRERGLDPDATPLGERDSGGDSDRQLRGDEGGVRINTGFGSRTGRHLRKADVRPHSRGDRRRPA